MASRAVFPLRWRNERLRALTAEVASRLGISQNELIEQAIEHEVIAQLQPPLNLAGNRAHPLAATVSAARRRFKDHASTQD